MKNAHNKPKNSSHLIVNRKRLQYAGCASLFTNHNVVYSMPLLLAYQLVPPAQQSNHSDIFDSINSIRVGQLLHIQRF